MQPAACRGVKFEHPLQSPLFLTRPDPSSSVVTEKMDHVCEKKMQAAKRD